MASAWWVRSSAFVWLGQLPAGAGRVAAARPAPIPGWRNLGQSLSELSADGPALSSETVEVADAAAAEDAEGELAGVEEPEIRLTPPRNIVAGDPCSVRRGWRWIG